MNVTVSGLCRYPVKSLAASHSEELEFSSLGPVGDRRWMIVDASGRFLTQRQLPQMCRLHAEMAGEMLVLRHIDSQQALSISPPLGTASPSLEVTVWHDAVRALDAGDRAADWLSAQLGRSLRLCYFPDDTFRQVDPDFAPPGRGVSFADGFPVLICNMATLDVLQTALVEQGSTTQLPMWRFRPNIVVAGADPFAEMAWRVLRIGDLEFELVKPCSRCVIPTLNPEDGKRQEDVLRALHQYCRAEDKQIYFGQNALLKAQNGTLKSSLLRVGMPVEVVA